MHQIISGNRIYIFKDLMYINIEVHWKVLFASENMDVVYSPILQFTDTDIYYEDG